MIINRSTQKIYLIFFEKNAGYLQWNISTGIEKVNSHVQFQLQNKLKGQRKLFLSEALVVRQTYVTSLPYKTTRMLRII